MLYGPILTRGLDEFLFEEFFDPLLPELPFGLPTPLPARLGLLSIDLQFTAGELIAAGEVAGKDQYTGMTRSANNARMLGYNLMYQPGGMKI